MSIPITLDEALRREIRSYDSYKRLFKPDVEIAAPTESWSEDKIDIVCINRHGFILKQEENQVELFPAQVQALADFANGWLAEYASKDVWP